MGYRLPWSAPQNISTGALNNPLYSIASFGTNVWIFMVDNAANLVISKSTDEGLTWSGFGVLATGVSDTPLDRGFVADTTTGALHLLYDRQVDNGGAPPILYYRNSLDGGNSWSGEFVFDDGSTHGNNRFHRVAMAATNGTVHVGWACISNTNFTTDGLFYRKSINAGNSWGSTVQPFAGTAVSPSRPDLCFAGNTVHFAWTDARFGSAYTGNPGESYYARSTDGGTNWTQRRMTTTATQWGSGTTLRPMMCCDAPGQRLTQVWQDPASTLNSPQGYIGGSEDLWYSHSEDAGVTWSTNTLLRHAAGAQQHCFLAQVGDIVSLTWASNETNTGADAQQMNTSISTNGGISFGPVIVPFIPNAVSAAPRTVMTNNYIVNATNDGTSGIYSTRLAYSANYNAIIPPVLDDAPNVGGPPPSASWGNNIAIVGGSDGLVVPSINNFSKSNTATFRQGSYWLSQMAADSVVAIKCTSQMAATNDGVTMYLSVLSPGTSTLTGYNVKGFFTAGSGTAWNLQRVNSDATITNLGTPFNQTLSVGDTLLLLRSGTSLSAWYLASGDTWGGNGVQLMSATDATYSRPGYVGVEVTGGGGNQNFKFRAFSASSLLGILGSPQVGQTLTCSVAGASLYRWQKADDTFGTNLTAVGTNQQTYVVQPADVGKFIRVGETP